MTGGLSALLACCGDAPKNRDVGDGDCRASSPNIPGHPAPSGEDATAETPKSRAPGLGYARRHMHSIERRALLQAAVLALLPACSSDGAGGAVARGTGGTNLTLKQPIDRGSGKLALEFGSTYFEVTPDRGGRITSLRQAGVELLILTGTASYDDALGSTFWPSPQTWGWPPPTEIDRGAYVASVDNAGIITAQGATNAMTSLQVAKRFSANLAVDAIDIEYSMTNTGAAPVQWAPWEITRMPATGLAFWPTGGMPFGGSPLVNQAVGAHTWVDPTQTQGEAKLFADGQGGYLAYVVGDRVLVKQFQDLPSTAAAPSEAEIEIYASPDRSYVEVENQGAYASIAPGETVRWQVTWYARQLPAGLTPSVGNADLISFVTKTLER
jgi:hypothetical protein